LKRSVTFVVIKTNTFGESVHLKSWVDLIKIFMAVSPILQMYKCLLDWPAFFKCTLSPNTFVFMTMKVRDRFKEIELGPVL
jgi:hypothetical protein